MRWTPVVTVIVGFLLSSCFVNDMKLKRDVVEALRGDSVVGRYVQSQKIKVSVRNGEVILSGEVPFPAVKDRAEELAKKAGAKSVKNEIKIVSLSGEADENPPFLDTSGLTGGLGF